MKSQDKNQLKKELFLNRVSKIFKISVEQSEHIFDKQLENSLFIINDSNDLQDFLNINITQKNIIPINNLSGAFYILQNKHIFTGSEYFKNGQIYIQNLSSLIPVLALNPLQSDNILDMCASPGGKTIQISKYSHNKAKITANDENHLRVQKMKNLFNTYNVNIDKYLNQPAQHLSKHLEPNSFDKILLDAPCSGDGLINLQSKDPLKYWSTKKIKRLSKLQKMLISQAFNLLKPRGTLIYSTCTLAPEENEQVIDWAISKFNNLSVQKIIDQTVKPNSQQKKVIDKAFKSNTEQIIYSSKNMSNKNASNTNINTQNENILNINNKSEISLNTTSQNQKELKNTNQEHNKNLDTKNELNSLFINEIDFNFGITSWLEKDYNNHVKKCIRVKPTKYTEAFFVCKITKNID